MAALWALTVLLLCAPFITLTQDVSTALPPLTTTTSTSPSVTSIPPPTTTTSTSPLVPSLPPPTPAAASTKPPLTSANLPSNSSQPLISPDASVTQSPPANTSNQASSKEQTQCSYTVTVITGGLQVNMELNSTAGNYRIILTEKGGTEIRRMFIVQSSNQRTHGIKHLKPCTTYQYDVAFIHNDGNETFCNHTEDKNGTVTTKEIHDGDIKAGGSTPGFISFQSDWDISSSLLKPNKLLECISKTCRLKLDIEDICSDFTATFTSGSCGTSSNVPKSITVDDIDPRHIRQTVSTGLPATIEPTLPSKCNNLSVDYTCSENGKVNDSKKLSELEPFTDYKCSGLIKNNSVSIDKRTPSIDVRINCRLALDIRDIKTTNTSIELTWTTTSNNCQDVLTGLQELSYDCSCRTIKYKSKIVTDKLMLHPGGGKCSFTGLTPFTDYTCDIDPTYKTISVGQRQSVSLKTDAGTPDKVTHMTVTLPENNVIKVSCDYGGQLFGPHKAFRARLNNEKPLENNKCDFEFRDLSFSTSYTVKVTVFNGVLESKPKSENISTKYNDKALIGFLGFLLIITVVVVFVLIYKIYMKKQRESRSGVNDDMMLESAIYMNTRPPGWRHKASR